MAVRMITIDLEAYERLSRLKEGKDSFSQVIKKYLPAPGSTAGDLLSDLDRVDVAEETLDAVGRVVTERRDRAVPVPPYLL